MSEEKENLEENKIENEEVKASENGELSKTKQEIVVNIHKTIILL